MLATQHNQHVNTESNVTFGNEDVEDSLPDIPIESTALEVYALDINKLKHFECT